MIVLNHTQYISLAAPLEQDGRWRCGGLMGPQMFLEFDASIPEMAVRRCVQCGDLVDSVILINRQQSSRRLNASVQCGVEQLQF